MRDDSLAGVPHARLVDVGDVLPVLLADQVGRIPEDEDPAFALTMFDVAELGYPVVERSLEAVVVPDVGLGGHDPPVQRLDRPDCLGQVLLGRSRIEPVHARHGLAQVHRDDVGAVGGQPDRVTAALAARRSTPKRSRPWSWVTPPLPR